MIKIDKMSTTPKSSPATRASEKRRLSEGSLKIEFNTPNKKARRQSAPLNGSKLSAGAYKDHTCPSCNQDLRHRKLSKVNFQKHVDKCEKVYPFIVNNNECKFCGKTGRVGYIGNHILENHSPQMNDEEETADDQGSAACLSASPASVEDETPPVGDKGGDSHLIQKPSAKGRRAN